MYRKIFPINILRRGTFLSFVPYSTQIQCAGDNLFKLDNNIDFIKIADELIVLNLDVLERFNGYSSLIQAEANIAVESIRNLELIENLDRLINRQVNTSFAKKLRRLQNSPVLQIPKTQILNFIQNQPTLSRLLPIKNDMIILNSKKAENALLSMLNDEYLKSLLTDIEYLAANKDEI